jgi:hypothetical protein
MLLIYAGILTVPLTVARYLGALGAVGRRGMPDDPGSRGQDKGLLEQRRAQRVIFDQGEVAERRHEMRESIGFKRYSTKPAIIYQIIY